VLPTAGERSRFSSEVVGLHLQGMQEERAQKSGGKIMKDIKI
jgi:hypothetical protein